MRRSIRIALLIAAALCVVRFFAVTDAKPEPGESQRQTAGLPFSPWFEWVQRREIVRDEEGNTLDKVADSWRVVWVSWSWLLWGGAGAGILGFRHLRPARASEGDAAW